MGSLVTARSAKVVKGTVPLVLGIIQVHATAFARTPGTAISPLDF